MYRQQKSREVTDIALTTNNVAPSPANSALSQTKAMPPQESGNTGIPPLYHRCANGKMVEMNPRKTSGFGWLSALFLRRDCNPADVAALDIPMQVGRVTSVVSMTI